jgi:cobalt-zinc-cadmium efflux system protein
MTVAAIGIVLNGLSAWLFLKGSDEDLNVRSAYLHMAADAIVSLGVVVTGFTMMRTGWYWLDPVVTLVIVVVIVRGTWGLFRESMQLAMNAVPPGVDVGAVTAYLQRLPGVVEVCDLHIWGLSTTESALTVRLVMPSGPPGDEFLEAVRTTLATRHAIHHCTLEVGQGTVERACALAHPHH